MPQLSRMAGQRAEPASLRIHLAILLRVAISGSSRQTRTETPAQRLHSRSDQSRAERPRTDAARPESCITRTPLRAYAKGNPHNFGGCNLKSHFALRCAATAAELRTNAAEKNTGLYLPAGQGLNQVGDEPHIHLADTFHVHMRSRVPFPIHSEALTVAEDPRTAWASHDLHRLKLPAALMLLLREGTNTARSLAPSPNACHQKCTLPWSALQHMCRADCPQGVILDPT